MQNNSERPLTQKQRIAVIFGGHSPEYDVSLKSAYSVITHIDNSKYELVMLGITKSGKWLRFSGDQKKVYDDTWNNQTDCVSAIVSPCRETQGLLEFSNGEIHKVKLDAAMPILHGKNGEDGTLQGLLELAGIPIVGCNTLSSALCMDKDRAHKLISLAGIKVAQSLVIDKNTDVNSAMQQAEKFCYPMFVKPVRAGSSFGITKVANKDEFPTALQRAFEHDNMAIIEENITGVEIGCAILGSDELIVGELDEIELDEGFFDYKEKYTLETSNIHVPARIPAPKAAEIKNTAKIIYNALGCSGFARVDMFLTPSGEIYFNEVNTIPGFTLHSRYPNMLKAIGMTFEQVVNKAIELTINT